MFEKGDLQEVFVVELFMGLTMVKFESIKKKKVLQGIYC
jgi:hypothetical protein